MNHKITVSIFAVLVCVVVLASAVNSDKPISIKGYVIDSACAFTKGLNKPISPDCATACAKAGSPLVILGDNGTIYWPIGDKTPAAGQNDKLLSFAGKRVTVSGKTFQRGGSTAVVIEKIGSEPAKK